MFILFVELSIEQSRFCRSWCHRSVCRMARMPLRALWTSSTPSQRLTALLLPQRTSTLLITAPSLRREDHSLLTASREPLELKYVPSVWLECLSSFFSLVLSTHQERSDKGRSGPQGCPCRLQGIHEGHRHLQRLRIRPTERYNLLHSLVRCLAKDRITYKPESLLWTAGYELFSSNFEKDIDSHPDVFSLSDPTSVVVFPLMWWWFLEIVYCGRQGPCFHLRSGLRLLCPRYRHRCLVCRLGLIHQRMSIESVD